MQFAGRANRGKAVKIRHPYAADRMLSFRLENRWLLEKNKLFFHRKPHFLCSIFWRNKS
jgi:hypothetical protein